MCRRPIFFPSRTCQFASRLATEPAAVALHGIRKLHIKAGDSAVVYGAGPIGNLAAQWLRIMAAAEF